MNESRPREPEISFEFFIDEERYFFLHLMQEVFGASIGILSLNTFLLYGIIITKHCCATYKIARLTYVFYQLTL